MTEPRAIDYIKKQLAAPSVQEQFKNALAENSGLFVASVIDLFGSSPELQECDPSRVIAECLKAATLKLPLNRSLGFAWVVPYKVKGKMTPQFQIGYKGFIQLALRTGQYRYINAGLIYEGIEVTEDILTGMVDFKGKPTSDKAQGYFAYLETLNGFKKTLYMPKDKVEKHAKRYSKAYSYEGSPWNTEFDAMAMKTCLRQLLSKYGYMSIEMSQAFSAEVSEQEEEEDIQKGIEAGANKKELLPAPGGIQKDPDPKKEGQGLPSCFQE